VVIRTRRRSEGYAIAVALIVLVLVGAAATAIAVGLRLETRAAQQESRRIHLVALADAAVAEALAELAQNKGFSGAAERRLGLGTISSSVRPLDADRFEIVATARLRGWEQQVVTEVVTTASTPTVVSWRIAF
jgi:type II secretory pathway pseudopilin PulG